MGNATLDNALTRDGQTLGLAEGCNFDTDGTARFDEILHPGDLSSGPFWFRGRQMVLRHIETVIGLLVDQKGARGPVWQGVTCVVLPRVDVSANPADGKR